jgi:hypothetical protein
MQAAKLRSELADTKSRLQELQADMLAFDPANFAHLDDDSDAILKQLRGQMSAYRKRLVVAAVEVPMDAHIQRLLWHY